MFWCSTINGKLLMNKISNTDNLNKESINVIQNPLDLTSVSCVFVFGNVTNERITVRNDGGGVLMVLISILVVCRSVP